jgi:5-methylcytosine-specific restriction protein A
LVCEVCQFDFHAIYGERGDGYIECHHTQALETLEPGAKTHIRDLVLVCSNCHRMIHRYADPSDLKSFRAGVLPKQN